MDDFEKTSNDELNTGLDEVKQVEQDLADAAVAEEAAAADVPAAPAEPAEPAQPLTRKEQKRAEKAAKKEARKHAEEDEIVLDIPESEIWTYRVEGLAAPHINRPYKNFKMKKILFVAIIVVAIGLSVFFSIRAVQKETFEYTKLDDGTYQLDKFSNTGFITDLTIENVADIVYEKGNPDPETNFTVTTDDSAVVTSIRDYALNCDEKIVHLTIGKDIQSVTSKSFYSCWWLQDIQVDEANTAYCDLDGVLYTKDMTTLVSMPVYYQQYLRAKYGYPEQSVYNGSTKRLDDIGDDELKTILSRNAFVAFLLEKGMTETVELNGTTRPLADISYEELEEYLTPSRLAELLRECCEKAGLGKAEDLRKKLDPEMQAMLGEAEFEKYIQLCFTYVVPSTVTKIDDLGMNYNKMRYIYLPETLEYIGTLAFFKAPKLEHVYAYTGSGAVYTSATTNPQYDFGTVYDSLPGSLTFIGSDAFSYDQALAGLYIPASVTDIGHHCWWEAVYIDKNDGKQLKGVTEIHLERSEAEFAEVTCGKQWMPEYDYMLFKKKVPVVYGVERPLKDAPAEQAE